MEQILENNERNNFFKNGIKRGRDTQESGLTVEKHSGPNAGVEMKPAALSLRSASGCPAGNQIMWNSPLKGGKTSEI